MRQWSAGSVTPVRTAVSFSRLVGVNDNNQQTTPQETSRADRFIAAFNGIEQTLREELGVPPGVYFTEVVKKARRTHIITEDIAESLFAYARLRNAISHDRYKNGEPIADPRPDVVAEIEGIRTIVTADTRVVQFCGSKKSLATGLPMAAVLFAGQPVGMIVLPLMVFHQIQLIVCSWLATRYGRAAASSSE